MRLRPALFLCLWVAGCSSGGGQGIAGPEVSEADSGREVVTEVSVEVRHDGSPDVIDGYDVPEAGELPDGAGGDPAGDPAAEAGIDAEAQAEVSLPAAEVVLNEANCHGQDWVEIANLSAANSADLSGWALTDGGNGADHTYLLPEGTVVPAGGWLAVYRQSESMDGFLFGLACGGDVVMLLTPDGKMADSVALPLVTEGNSFGRLPDKTGEFAENTPTPGAENQPAPDVEGILFDPFQVVEIDLELPPVSVDSLFADHTIYVPGTFAITGPDFSYEPMEVGVRLKGKWGSFRTLDGKAAFKVKFNFNAGDQRFLGLKGLTLNNMVQDPAMVHEVASYELFSGYDVPCPRTGYAWVRVNGEDYGLYLLLERYDDVFLSRFYQSTEHLYEGEYGTDVVPGDIPAFDVDEGDDNEFGDLFQFVDVAYGTPDEQWYGAVSQVADFPEMLRMWAIEQYIGHWDGYAPTINNYYLHSDEDWIFTMLPNGTDQTFADFRDYHSGAGLLFARCMEIADCRKAYDAALFGLLAVVDTAMLEPLVTDLSAFLEPWVAADPRKPYSAEDQKGWVAAMLDFLKNRRADAESVLACLMDPASDQDLDGFACDADCDESDPLTHKGAPEICNDWKDQDCNGIPDDGYDCPDCKEVWRGPHRYLICPTGRPWAEAVAHCADAGSQMVMVDSIGEEDWLRQTLAAHGLDQCWLGLSDLAEEGVWTSADGTQPVFLDWAPGEPNNAGDEDCGQQYGWGQWNDIFCDAALPVACEDPCLPGQDDDQDGYLRCSDDCDDGDPAVHPGATDKCLDGIDQDCSGTPDDAAACFAPIVLDVQPPAPGWLFVFIPDSLPAESARQICAGLAPTADLAWFGSLAQDQAVRLALDLAAPGSEPWIGLNDQAVEGTYGWYNGVPLAFTNWADGQPNNGSGSGEQDCCRMLGDGTWNDTDCLTLHPALCRLPAG